MERLFAGGNILTLLGFWAMIIGVAADLRSAGFSRPWATAAIDGGFIAAAVGTGLQSLAIGLALLGGGR